MKSKNINLSLLAFALCIASPVHAQDGMPTVELKGEWIVIICPKDDARDRDAWNAAIRADVITSIESSPALSPEFNKPDKPYLVNLDIRTSELIRTGGTRILSIPAGNSESAPGFLKRLVELIDSAKRSRDH